MVADPERRVPCVGLIWNGAVLAACVLRVNLKQRGPHPSPACVLRVSLARNSAVLARKRAPRDPAQAVFCGGADRGRPWTPTAGPTSEKGVDADKRIMK